MQHRSARFTHKTMTGFTIIELLVVVAVIALLIAIIGPRIARVFSGTNATAHISEATDLSSCIRSVYGNRSDFSTATIATIAQRCAQENRQTIVAGVITGMTNPGGSAVTIVAPAAGGNQLPITWPNVPSDVCGRMVDGIGQGFAAITAQPAAAAAATVIKAVGGQVVEANVPIGCGNATTSTLVLTLDK